MVVIAKLLAAIGSAISFDRKHTCFQTATMTMKAYEVGDSYTPMEMDITVFASIL